jgi:spermidine/putrescine transport system permease protein
MILRRGKKNASTQKTPFWTRVFFFFALGVIYIPLITTFLSAFSNAHQWTFRWFQELWQNDEILDAIKRSAFVSFWSCLLATSLGTFAAIGLAHIRKKQGNNHQEPLHARPPHIRLANFFRSQLYLLLMMPEIVFALSLLTWFSILRFELGLWTVIISHTVFCIAYVVLTIESRLQQLDPILEDVAHDLGARPAQILQLVLIPNLWPAIASSAVLCLLLSFDDFLITFFVNGVGQDTLPIKIYTSLRVGASPALDALTFLLFLCSSILCLLFIYIQKKYSKLS